MKCRGNPISRRGFLGVGVASGLGLSLPQFLSLRAALAAQKNPPPIKAVAKSVIHIFLPGGMAHQESFDPKPHAPVRSPRSMGRSPVYQQLRCWKSSYAGAWKGRPLNFSNSSQPSSKPLAPLRS